MNERMHKINSLIKREVTEIISKEVDMKDSVFVTISKVHTLSDLQRTTIHVLVFPTKEAEYGIKTLEHEKYTIQKILHKKLHLKVLPKIEFALDQSGENVDEINTLLKT